MRVAAERIMRAKLHGAERRLLDLQNRGKDTTEQQAVVLAFRAQLGIPPDEVRHIPTPEDVAAEFAARAL